jgi:hypothetical protein
MTNSMILSNFSTPSPRWRLEDTNRDARVVIPTNEARRAVEARDSIQPPPDDPVVPSHPELPPLQPSATVDAKGLRFLYPDRSSNMRHLSAGGPPGDVYRARSATAPASSPQSQADLLTILGGFLYQQSQRLSNEIDRSLAEVRYGDDETCQEVEHRLAYLINFLGELGLYGAKQALDSRSAADADSETLLRSIARSLTTSL